MKGRFPRSVYAHGSEPDPRFSLANERTFLAWVRTSLALVAAGVALEALQLPTSPGFRLASVIVFLTLGVLAAIQAWTGWLRTEKSLRQNRVLPGVSVGLLVVVGIVSGTGLLTLGLIW